jgi:Secretion system C-terminal sorting domain
MKKIFLLILGFSFVKNVMLAQTVTIGGGASVTCPATPTATYTPAVTGVTFSNWSRGSGVTCASAANGLSGSGFNSADNAAAFSASKYYAITLTSTTHKFDLTNIVWSTAISSGPGTFTVKYSLNGGPVTDFGTPNQTGTTSNTFSGVVNVNYGENIALYFVVHGANASTRTVRLINGSTISLANVLPVTLTSFDVKNILNKNEMAFRTASEQNNSHFEIERSTDGKIFTAIGRVEGNGTTILPQSYTFTDATPAKGINYYRLKQVDFDGRFEYSMVKSAHNGIKRLEANVLTTQNDNVAINIFSENYDDATIQIFDLNGRLMTAQNIALNENMNRINLDVALPSGLFVVKINTTSGQQVSKTMIVK